MAKPAPPFKTEAELCAAFVVVAKAAGWDVHPEVNGTDLLCVATSRCTTTWDLGDIPVEEGTQLVVEAKLRANLDVLCQAMPPGRYIRQAADFYAVLVPSAPSSFRKVARRCGVNTIEAASWSSYYESWTIKPELRMLFDRHVRLPGQKSRWVPDVVVDAPAGMPAPRSTTPWKLRAVRFCLDFDGVDVMSDDFKAAKIDMKRWLDLGWISDTGRRAGRKRLYRLCSAEHTPARPDVEYPELVAAIQPRTTPP